MYWSSAAAPLYTTFNGYGVMRTTPTLATLNAISSQTYNNLPTGSQSYSVVAVFKPNSVASKVLFTAGSIVGGERQKVHSICIGSNLTFVGGTYPALGTWSSSVGTSPSTSQYVVMVTTFDGTTERVYINGVFEKSATMTPAIPVSASNKVVLGWPDNIAFNMDADVGAVLMYNRALSSSEAAQMYGTFALRFAMPTSGTNV